MIASEKALELLVSKMITLDTVIATDVASQKMQPITRTLIPLRDIWSEGMIKKMTFAGITCSHF